LIMANPLRVGIAGAGWVASDRHAPVLLSTEGVRIVAVYDRDRDRAARLGERIPKKGEVAVPCFDDLASFLAEGLDIVHVTSSPQSHHDISIAALGSGAHVFTEKPMAMSPREAEAMALEAQQRSRLLCVSHNFLSSSSMQAARRRIGNERVDYVSGLQLSSYQRRLPKWYGDLPGGLMFDEIPHMVYSIGALLGGPLDLDHARATFDEAHHPKTVEVLLRGQSGNGQITMVFCSPVSEWHIMASSSAGIVGVDLFRDIMTHVRPDGAHGSLDIARSSMSALGGHVSGFARAGARWALKRQFWGHDRLIREFVEAVRTGKASPVPVSDALGVVVFTQQLLESLDLGLAKSPA
jgi:scyllo-inositol 2-dehydrogenase (NADP+)